MTKRTVAMMCAVLGLWLAACGDDDNFETSTATDSTDASDTDDTTTSPESVSLTACFSGSQDVALLAELQAIDNMIADGYDIEKAFVANTELCIDGLQRGEFQIAAAYPPSLPATAAGASNIPVVGLRTLNGNVMVAQSGLKTCDDLDGKTFAIHSEGSFMNALFKLWRTDNCSPETEIKTVVIAGSGNRTQALIGGQIDATGVEQQDMAYLEQTYDDRYDILSRVASDYPDIIVYGLNTNVEFMENNRDAVKELLRQMTVVAREWEADPASFGEAIDHYLPDLDPGIRDYFVNVLGAGEFFPLNGNITKEAIEVTNEFYVEGGSIEEAPPIEEVADLSLLEEVLEELGIELALNNQ